MKHREIQISFEDKQLFANLSVPDSPLGLVVFSHGTGSGRNSPRNQFVARELNQSSIATMLLDLLTKSEEREEEAGAMRRFDIDFLSERLKAAVVWSKNEPTLKSLPVGLFGASTGAASALQVAGNLDKTIAAVVSRGGRPDLAKNALPSVKCPVLLIVGGEDHVVIELNRRAYAQLNGAKQLEIVPRATHLFEEPGTLEQVAQLAADWFKEHFNP